MSQDDDRNFVLARRLRKPHISRIAGVWRIYCPTGYCYWSDTFEVAADQARRIGKIRPLRLVK